MGSKYNAVVPKMEDKHKQTKNTGHSIWKQQKKLQNLNHSKWLSDKTS